MEVARPLILQDLKRKSDYSFSTDFLKCIHTEGTWKMREPGSGNEPEKRQSSTQRRSCASQTLAKTRQKSSSETRKKK